jgi:hypothetical protein
MTTPVSDLSRLLATLQPELQEGVYVFTSVPPDTNIQGILAVATFREKEGLTLIVEEGVARQHGLPVLFRAAWLTLTVHSDLEAVGLTAAVAAALTDAGICCNVVAAANHDHLLVPIGRAQEALAVLKKVQEANLPRLTHPS